MTLTVQPGISPFPSDAEIRRILVERIDVEKQSVGIAIATFDPAGRNVVCHGRLSTSGAGLVTGDTVFEIGSITKLFTALLLADMAGRGELGLDDPVARHLPDTVRVPQRGDREITLTDLATHTSGLPRLPDNFAPANDDNPYADYTVEQLYAFLTDHSLTRDIGSLFEYSNVGLGLLGHALARCAGMDYAALLKQRILGPLGMTATAVDLTPQMRSRLAQGHDAAMMPTSNWDLPTLAGAGALKSTVNDLLNFVEMASGARPSPLSAALATTLALRRPNEAPGVEVGLGWMISGDGEALTAFHSGGTGGYCSFLACMPERGIGVVGLSNAATENGIDDICVHILDQKHPLAAPPKTRIATSVDPDVLERYVGTFRLEPDFELVISREEDRLFAQATGQGKAEIFAESGTFFFYKVVNAQISFEVDADGRASALTLHQNGRDMPAHKVGAKTIHGGLPTGKHVNTKG